MSTHPAARPGRVEVLPADRRNDGTEALDRLDGLSLRNVEAIAGVAAKAGMFRSLTKEQAMLKVIAGLELRMPIVQALGGLDIVQGQVQMRSSMMAQLIKRSGRYRYRVERWDAEACELVWLEKVDGAWEVLGPSSFTVEEAGAAGLLNDPKRPAWQSFRKAMLMNRAISQGAKAYAADALGGAVYDEDELPAEPRSYEEHTEVLGRGRVEALGSPPTAPDTSHEASGDPFTPPGGAPLADDPIRAVEEAPLDGPLARRGQAQAFRALVKRNAPGLDEGEEMSRIIRWASDGQFSTPEELVEPRLVALRGVFEAATEDAGLIPALIRTVAGWEASVAASASGDATAPASQEAPLSNPSEAGTAAAPAPTDGQAELL